MKRKKTIYIFIICVIIFMGLNILLLSRNVKLKENAYILNKQISLYKDELYLKNIEVTEEFLKNQVITDSRIELPKTDFSFILLIPLQSCDYLESEMYFINQIYKLSKPNFSAYVIAGENSLMSLERFGAQFPYKFLNPSIPVIDSTYNFDKPISLLVDSEGLIHKAMVSDGRNSEKMDQFYQEIDSFIEK